MSEQKKWYLVGVAVPARDADEAAGIGARLDTVVYAPRVERLTASEAKPINILARDEIHEQLKGIDRGDVEVANAEVCASFPFA